MTATPDSSALLGRALDQTERLLTRATPDRFDDPTPCEDWRGEEPVPHAGAPPPPLVSMLSRGGGAWDNPPPPGARTARPLSGRARGRR